MPLHLSGISVAITLVLEQSNEIHYGQLLHKQYPVYKLYLLKQVPLIWVLWLKKMA